MAPLWFKLIQHRNNTGGFGLTIPYLVGALRASPSNDIDKPNFQQLLSLLISMRDETPSSHYVHVSECDSLLQPVVNISSSFFKPSPSSHQIFSRLTNRPSLSLQVKYVPDRSREIDSAAEELWLVSAHVIERGYFSFRDGAFRPFDERDLAFIRDALSEQSPG